MLVQERMSHIEELRLIHADINIVWFEDYDKDKHIGDFCLDGNNYKTS